MELADEFAQVKAEFAEKIALGEDKSRNMRFDKLKRQHYFKKMTSDSRLGKRKKECPLGQSDKNCAVYGSSGSLPSVFFVERGESWVCSDEFEEDKKINKNNEFDEKINNLNDIEGKLQGSLEVKSRADVRWSKMESSQFHELENEVTKLQAKINEMSQSVVNPTSTKRLVSFLEAFKSELPCLEDSSSVSSFDSGIDSGVLRQSINSFEGRDSIESYRPAWHPRQTTPPLPGRAVTCITQFSRAVAVEESLLEENDPQAQVSSRRGMTNIPEIGTPGSFLTEMIESYASALSRTQLFGPTSMPGEVSSSAPVDVVPVCAPLHGKTVPCAPAPGRAPLNRSRVRMGARTVQSRAVCGEGSVRERPGRAFSSSDLLGENKDQGDEVVDMQEVGNLTPRSLQSRARSHSHILSSGDDPKIGDRQMSRAKVQEPEHSISNQRCTELKKKKDESKVGKFFKRLKKLVKIKEEKDEDDQDEMKLPKKMTRSFSYSLEKTRNLPKRLKSLNASSARLNID